MRYKHLIDESIDIPNDDLSKWIDHDFSKYKDNIIAKLNTSIGVCVCVILSILMTIMKMCMYY